MIYITSTISCHILESSEKGDVFSRVVWYQSNTGLPCYFSLDNPQSFVSHDPEVATEELFRQGVCFCNM